MTGCANQFDTALRCTLIGVATCKRRVDAFQPDVIVLARYMQIIPKAMCDKYSGRIINIHHSDDFEPMINTRLSLLASFICQFIWYF
jgi:formyltetrahydrofolate hydrolase